MAVAGSGQSPVRTLEWRDALLPLAEPSTPGRQGASTSGSLSKSVLSYHGKEKVQTSKSGL